MKNVVPRLAALAALLIATAGSPAARGQCLTAWLYKAPITVSNAGGALTDYQLLVTTNTQALISAGKMRPDGGDIRFIVNEGTCTQACFWIESGLNTPNTRIWVKVPAIPAGVNSTIYMYYGNNAATSVASVDCVFLLFDDFNGTALDGSKWTAYGTGTATVSGGTISFSAPSASRVIRSNATLTPPVVTEMQVSEATGTWPNIAQLNSGTWNGFGPMLGSPTIRIGWTLQSGTNYSGSWTSTFDRTAGNTTGLWSFAWPANGDQRFTWPGGAVNTTYTNYAPTNVNVALGLLQTTSVATSKLTVEWVRARKYANPEPGTLVQAEQALLPVITRHPQDVRICEGRPASLSAEAIGVGLTYQWRRNGFDIPLATSPTYSIPATNINHDGIYDVVIKGLNGVPVTSNEASITVDLRPTITAQPGNQNVCRGTTATFICIAIGTDIHYQWRRNGVPIEGATGPTLSLVAQPYSVGSYDVVISGACSPVVTSEPATLAVQLDAMITEQPLDQTVDIGNRATFTVKTMGGGFLSYQWQKDGRNIPNATSSSYTIQSVTVKDIGDYNVVIRGTICPAELTVSNKASLVVPTQLGIIDEPQSQTACPGTPASFSINTTGANLSYQWRIGGVPIPGANSRRFAIDQVEARHVGSYDVVVAAPGGMSMVSKSAQLSMVETPVITRPPGNRMACEGKPVRFTVELSLPAASYQWRRNGAPIQGATGQSYDLPAMATEKSGMYDVVIGDHCGNFTTSPAAKLELNTGPVIVEQPADRNVAPGESVTFSVTAIGDGLRYQWRRNGIDIPGADEPTYRFVISSDDNDNGDYDVVISDDCGFSTTSRRASLLVSTSSVPVMTEATTGGAMMTAVPHPAHGATQLRITLPQGMQPRAGASLQLFDMHGRRVLDLSESFARNGFALVEFDASILPSGTYYCHLATSEWNGTLGSIVVEK